MTNPQRCRQHLTDGQNRRKPAVLLIALACLGGTLGCEQPRRNYRLPPDCLPVRYEAATTYATCLVSSVAMGANYLLGDRKLSERQIQVDLKRLHYDETRVGDLKAYLRQLPERLYLVTLTGQLDAEPPTGLRYWLEKRGYPVICVINRDPGCNPGFNHAVLVIGISKNQKGSSADIIHYLDPSSVDQLHSAPVDEFEMIWSSGDRAMMIVCQDPT